MRPAMLLVFLVACGRRDDTSSRAATPPAPPSALIASQPTPDAAPAPPDAAIDATLVPQLDPAVVTRLDAMLDEIDTAWRKTPKKILVPKARTGFRVTEDFGVPILVPEVDLPFADVVQHLAARAKNVKNSGVTTYTDGTLVALDATGHKALHEPVVLPLNDKLILFVQRRRSDPRILGRIDVAMP